MKKKPDAIFWSLVVSFIFGLSLHWPLWSKLTTILLSGAVLVQVSNQFFRVYAKEK